MSTESPIGDAEKESTERQLIACEKALKAARQELVSVKSVLTSTTRTLIITGNDLGSARDEIIELNRILAGRYSFALNERIRALYNRENSFLALSGLCQLCCSTFVVGLERYCRTAYAILSRSFRIFRS
jgi:hypothetical protein